MVADLKDELKDLNLGQKIRTLRQRKGMPVSEVASKTGLSEPLLSQIESEVVAPPVATLLKISKCLGVNIGYFFLDQDTEKHAVIVPKNERKKIFRRIHEDPTKVGYYYESLAYPKADKHMEPFHVTFEVKRKEDLLFFTHPGEEFIYVLDGQLEFNYEDQTYSLAAGDSLYFDCSIPHAFRATGKKNALAIDVIYAAE
ncbi:MAG TPA: cupin domain-containing protein [Thermodesulfobacteriota bacterium]|nr:cupin domain-containing protein [Thermodesulfobacteriota bacterium]